MKLELYVLSESMLPATMELYYDEFPTSEQEQWHQRLDSRLEQYKQWLNEMEWRC